MFVRSEEAVDWTRVNVQDAVVFPHLEPVSWLGV